MVEDLDSYRIRRKIEAIVLEKTIGPGFNYAHPDVVAWHVAKWYVSKGNWPTPEQVYESLMNEPFIRNSEVSLADAQWDLVNALNGTVFPCRWDDGTLRIVVSPDDLAAMRPYLAKSLERAS